jgi:hypothetical protein
MPRLSRTLLLVLLPAIAAVQQGRYVARAVLPAQDAVDVVSVAQRFQREGIVATLRTESVSPLFPLTVAAAHGVAEFCGIIEAKNWASPPQWVAAAAMIAAVVPIFLAAERLAGRTAAVVASLWFIFLPSFARLGGDGIGDALHLCLAAWGAWCWIDGRRFLAGLLIAAALLVRAEAGVVPLALLLLGLMQRECRSPRFFLAAALCLAPFLAVGITSPTEIVARLRGGAAAREDVPLNGGMYWLTEGIYWGDEYQELQSIGRKDPARSSRFHGLAATTHEFVDEMLQAYAYVLLPLVGVGFLVRRRRGFDAADRLILAVLGIHGVMTFATAWHGGYLSTRHFALPVALTLPYAVLGLQGLLKLASDAIPWKIRSSEFGIRLATVGFAAASVLLTTRPLHESLAAHRQAAAWLEAKGLPNGAVLDQQGLTALYTGRTTWRFGVVGDAFNDAMLSYVVLERQDVDADTPRGALIRRWIGDDKQAVARFPSAEGKPHREVLVFACRSAANVEHGKVTDAR